jgi:hypothetical protein
MRIVTGAPLERTGPIVVTMLLATAMLAISPLTVVCVLALATTTWAACRGLEGAERRAMLVIMLLAIALRVALVLGLFGLSQPDRLTSFSWDSDGRDVELRALMVRNIWLGIPVSPYAQYLAFTDYGWSSYIYVLAYVQYLFGPSPYAVHLVSICCYMAGAVLMHRMMRRWYGPIPALLAAALIVFLPSMILWSVAAMRESFQFLALALCVIGLVRAACERGLAARIGGLIVFVVSLWLVDTVRDHALTLMLAVAMAAMAATFATRRAYLLLLALLVVPPVALRVLEHPIPSIQARVLENLRGAAVTHRSKVNDIGHSYKLLDERFYWQEPMVKVVETMTWDEAQRYAWRGLLAVALEPFPWQSWSTTEVLFIPQQMIWYALLCLALVGVARGLRTAVFPTWVFIALTVITCVGIAPNEGNIGTMVRHRDMILPFLACVSALGMVSLLSWAGLWSKIPTEAVTPVPPTFGERIVGGSAVVRAIRGSVAYGLTLRPSIGYQRDPYSLPHRRPVEDLSAWFAASGVGRLSMATGGVFLATWRGSAVASAAAGTLAEIRALQPWQQFRVAGLVSLVSLVVAAPFSRGGEQGWPAVVVWAVACAGATITMLGARPLGAAWRQKTQNTMAPVPSPSIEATA